LIEGWDVNDGNVCELEVQDVEQDVLRLGVHLTKDDGERDAIVWFHEAVIEARNRRCQAKA
jgi:hypothetical protein